MNDAFSLNVGKSMKSETGAWYRNVQTLGHGGNATTFLALATSGETEGVLFAIKVFRKISQPIRKRAFLEEIQFLRGAVHPSIMRVHDAGIFIRMSAAEPLEYPFVAAEYLPKTLSVVIRENTASLAEKLSYALQLLSALAYLETRPRPVIHRDIKPQNIFVKGGSCVLGDFGLMKFLDAPDDEDREILKESELPGMPFYYRTPDLIRYARKEVGITSRSDIFQLGLVLAELFTGRNPAPRPAHILDDMELESINHIGGSMGAGIASLIKRMLVFDPATRPGPVELLRGWEGVFHAAVERSHDLEGRVF